jgi:hypothetical protein
VTGPAGRAAIVGRGTVEAVEELAERVPVMGERPTKEALAERSVCRRHGDGGLGGEDAPVAA